MPNTRYTPKLTKSSNYYDTETNSVARSDLNRTVQIKHNSELFLNMSQKVEVKLPSNLSINSVNELQAITAKSMDSDQMRKSMSSSQKVVYNSTKNSLVRCGEDFVSSSNVCEQNTELSREIQQLRGRLLVMETENKLLKITLEKQYSEFTYSVDDTLLSHRTISDYDSSIVDYYTPWCLLTIFFESLKWKFYNINSIYWVFLLLFCKIQLNELKKNK